MIDITAVQMTAREVVSLKYWFRPNWKAGTMRVFDGAINAG